MAYWKRTAPIQQFRASNGMLYPSFWQSWLTWRDQLTSHPGISPFWDRILEFIPPRKDGSHNFYWTWTTSDIETAFNQALERKTGKKPENSSICPQCDGTGRVHVAISNQPAYPDGWDLWCLCALVEKVREWFELYHPLSSNPIEPATISSFNIKGGEASINPTLQDAQNQAARFVLDPTIWVGFTGMKGTGKTHLLRAIATAMGPGVSMYITGSDFSDTFWKLYNQGEGLMEDWLIKIKTVPLLLFDDLGTGYMVKSGGRAQAAEGTSMTFAMSKLHSIIDYRWRNRAEYPFVFTSNESLADFRSDLWGIVGDRLADNANIVLPMVGSSYRQSSARAGGR